MRNGLLNADKFICETGHHSTPLTPASNQKRAMNRSSQWICTKILLFRNHRQLNRVERLRDLRGDHRFGGSVAGCLGWHPMTSDCARFLMGIMACSTVPHATTVYKPGDPARYFILIHYAGS